MAEVDRSRVQATWPRGSKMTGPRRRGVGGLSASSARRLSPRSTRAGPLIPSHLDGFRDGFPGHRHGLPFRGLDRLAFDHLPGRGERRGLETGQQEGDAARGVHRVDVANVELVHRHRLRGRRGILE